MSESKEFKQNVKDFNEVSSLIDVAKEKLKVLTTRKKSLEDTIVVFMKHNNVTEAVTKKNKLVFGQSKRKVPVKKKDAEKNLADFFDSLDWDSFMELTSIQKADAVNAYLASKRKTVTQCKLACRKMQAS